LRRRHTAAREATREGAPPAMPALDGPPPPSACSQGEAGPERRRSGVLGRTRQAAATAAGAAGAGAILLARLLMTAAVLIALLIGLAILLRDADANAGNTIVKGIHDGANFFAGSFTGLFTFSGHPKRAISVNWGIALVVYLIVGAVLATYIARMGRGGLRLQGARRSGPVTY